ncbi:MmcQ/YjbR family DNA-binding protein [Pedobacter cryophilus]|uniref:MmcQ/YjbR family DNA-binding protein n=1 Tax=Pedobacter cryophilus TaxID=2571271 RepID=A0A4U1C5E4_9SPHI|nr:MmcQ/YjbR family DNA-binding protein [Pedobacter cryophilus]TKC00599.1 MmcQ/YjbR family DNA-binding protein [Pedobacter cryophilus]
MHIESLREYCISKKGVLESFPFSDDTLVFKVANKIFLLASLDQPISFNVKCDPEEAIILREKHSEVLPGYHMNKKHWNTVYYNGSLSEIQIFEMIDHSYNLVLQSLPKILQNQINQL